MKKLKTLAVVSLALAAGNAAAALTVPGTGAAPNPSSVLFAAQDLNASSANYLHTFYLDLSLEDHAGLNYASFVNGTQGADKTLTWDLTKLSSFNGFAGDLSNLNWSVIGGYNKDNNTFGNLDSTGANSAFTAVAQWGALVTGTKVSDFVANGALNISNQLVSTSGLGKFFNEANSIALVGAATNTVDQGAYSSTASYYKQYFTIGTLGASGTKAPSTTGAASEGFFWITNPSLSASANVITQLGTFKLGANDVLTYTPSAVPLPTSVWLFLSGLMGVLGYSRRNRNNTTNI